MTRHKKIVLATVTITIAHFTTFCASKKNMPEESKPQIHELFKAHSFDFQKKGVTLSDDQLNQHVKLYHGYVKKRNEITQSLETVDRSNVANITYSPFRSLKIAQTFAHNGSLLHQLYFENLGKSQSIGKQTLKLIKKNFGSVENFKKDLMDSASCARGWVLTAYCLDDKTVKNFVLDAHNETVPIFVVPLLVVDTYEHAYMIDYGINRAQYLADLWNNIDWNVVEERTQHWMKKLK